MRTRHYIAAVGKETMKLMAAVSSVWVTIIILWSLGHALEATGTLPNGMRPYLNVTGILAIYLNVYFIFNLYMQWNTEE